MTSTDATIPYARPMSAPATATQRAWAGFAVCCAGLGVLVIGGCFLIGVLLISTNGFNAGTAYSITRSSIQLMILLYVLAGVAFVFGSFILFHGIRSLLTVVRQR